MQVLFFPRLNARLQQWDKTKDTEPYYEPRLILSAICMFRQFRRISICTNSSSKYLNALFALKTYPQPCAPYLCHTAPWLSTKKTVHLTPLFMKRINDYVGPLRKKSITRIYTQDSRLKNNSDRIQNYWNYTNHHATKQASARKVATIAEETESYTALMRISRKGKFNQRRGRPIRRPLSIIQPFLVFSLRTFFHNTVGNRPTLRHPTIPDLQDTNQPYVLILQQIESKATNPIRV